MANAWSLKTLLGQCDNERERSLVRDAYQSGAAKLAAAEARNERLRQDVDLAEGEATYWWAETFRLRGLPVPDVEETTTARVREIEVMRKERERLLAIADELRMLLCPLCSDGIERDDKGYHTYLDLDDLTIREKCEAWTEEEEAIIAAAKAAERGAR